jgi:hypothetical protein
MADFAWRASINSASAWRDLEVVLRFVLRLARDEALVAQVDGALVLGFESVRFGLRAIGVGLLHRVVELDQHRALRDALAFLEEDLRDAPDDLRAQDHGLVGTQAADRGQRLRQAPPETLVASTTMPAGALAGGCLRRRRLAAGLALRPPAQKDRPLAARDGGTTPRRPGVFRILKRQYDGKPDYKGLNLRGFGAAPRRCN